MGSSGCLWNIQSNRNQSQLIKTHIMAELKTREDEHSPIVRMNQLEIVISKLSN